MSRASLCAALVRILASACLAGALVAPVSAHAAARGPQPADEVVERELERKRDARAREDLQSERERRRTSRRAFAGLSRTEAIDALRRWHPAFALLPAWRAPDIPSDHQIVGYDGDFTAFAQGPNGSREVVASSVPMRATDGSGLRRPVDLSLEEADGGLRAANPIADIRLDRRLPGGLTLAGPGVVVRPQVGGHDEALLTGDTLVYANAWQDTDVVVRPLATGFSFNLHVRSEASPEAFAFDLETPAGLTLHAVRAKDVIEVRRGEEVVAAITAPVGQDADARRIDLTWRLVGSRLEIEVPHRAEDFAYPLLVDPDVVETFEWERYGANAGYGNWAGWLYGGSGPFTPNAQGYNVHAFQGDGWLGTGLYIRNNGTTYYYDAGNAGWWGFRAGIARIRQVEFNMFDQDSVEGTCTELGITGPNGWRSGSLWSACHTYWNQYWRQYSGLPADEVVFKVQAAPWSGNRSRFASQLGVVYLHLTDVDAPALASGLPDGWVNWEASRRLDIWAIDSSLGVADMTVNAPGWQNPKVIGTQTYSRCARTYLCPHGHATDGTTPNWKDGTSTPDVTVDTMSEGINTISVTAKDPGTATSPGNQQTSAATGFVPAGAGLRGDYFNNADLTALAHTRRDAQVNFNWGTGSPHTSVGSESFSVRWTGYVHASQTGLHTFETNTDDGVKLWIDNTPATGRPSTERLYALNGTRYLGGVKTINEPVIDKWRDQGATRYTNTVWLDQGKRYRIVMEYYDASGAAVAELRWKLPGASTFALVPSTQLSPPGGWTLRLDRTNPTITRADGSLRRESVGEGIHELQIETNDQKAGVADTAGVATIEVFVRTPDGAETRKHLASNTNTTTFQFDARASSYMAGTGYAEGEHGIRIRVTDRAGNFTEDSFDVGVDRTAPSFEGGVRPGGTLEPGNHAVVSWYPALDGDLPDGTQGAGVTGYTVRYRRNGGAYTSPVFTAYPSVEYDGATLGESVEVELRAHDDAGNLSSTVTAQTTVGDTNDCDGSSATECQDPAAGDYVDSEADPEFEMTEDDSSQRSTTTTATNSAKRYRLQATSDTCKTLRCWTTIRNQEQSWAVGMTRLEYIDRSQMADNIRVTSTITENQRSSGWSLGSLSWYSGSCGWVWSRRTSDIGRPDDAECPDNYRPNFRNWQSKPFGGYFNGKLVRGNNCQNASGNWRRVGKNTCDHGTGLFMVRPGIQCANVYAIPDGNTNPKCKKRDIVDTIGEGEWSGYCVDWRYITRDRDWVMVRDTHRTNLRGGWVFMRLRSFEQNRSLWKAYDERGTCNSIGA